MLAQGARVKVYLNKVKKVVLQPQQHARRLGSIHPVGAAPGAFTPASSYAFGVGAFLLAGTEVIWTAPEMRTTCVGR